MAIKAICKPNGESRFEVSINLRSKKDRLVRIQKRKLFDTLRAAERGEKILRDESMRELFAREQQGIAWENLINEWERFVLANNIETELFVKELHLLRRLTVDLFRKPASVITHWDIKNIVKKLSDDEFSYSGKKKFLAIINRVYKFSHDVGLMPMHITSPAYGVAIDKPEEKEEEILTREEIDFFLTKGNSRRLSHKIHLSDRNDPKNQYFLSFPRLKRR